MKKLLFTVFAGFFCFYLAAGEQYIFDVGVVQKSDELKRIFGTLDVLGYHKEKDGTNHYSILAEESEIARFEGFPVTIRKIIAENEFITNSQRALSMSAFHDFDAVMKFMDDLEKNYPKLVKIYELGVTANEANPIRAIKISTDPSKNLPDKTEVVFTGGHHAREWIGIEVSLYLAKFLAQNYKANDRITKIVDSAEIWIVPLVNPDGFIYSHTNDRLWRKNRTKFKINGNDVYGVDLNRNYDSNFCGQGSSDQPNNDTYCGPKAFSEKETQAVRNLIGDKEIAPMNGWTDDVKGFLDYHSYSQLILYPYGYTEEKSPRNDEMAILTNTMAEIIFKQSGMTYTAQKASELYLASGTTDDWFHDAHDQKVGLCIELRPVDQPFSSGGGFELSPSEIAGTVKENIPAALYFMEYLISNETDINIDVNGDSKIDYFDNVSWEETPVFGDDSDLTDNDNSGDDSDLADSDPADNDAVDKDLAKTDTEPGAEIMDDLPARDLTVLENDGCACSLIP